MFAAFFLSGWLLVGWLTYAYAEISFRIFSLCSAFVIFIQSLCYTREIRQVFRKLDRGCIREGKDAEDAGEEAMLVWEILRRLSFEIGLKRCPFVRVEWDERSDAYAVRSICCPPGIVGVDKGLIAELEPEELEAVIAHEVAHIKESRMAFELMEISTFFFLLFGPFWFMATGYLGSNGIDIFSRYILLICIGTWIMGWLGRRLLAFARRQEEFRADIQSALWMGSTEPLKSGLTKISSQEIEMIFRKIIRRGYYERTHPWLEERIRLLETVEIK